MKRLLIALVVLWSLAGNGHAYAVQLVDVEIDVSSLGDGWRYEQSAPSGGPLETWVARHVLLGPDGSRVLILVHDIGQTISERGYEWDQLIDRLSIYAGYHAFGMESETDPGISDLSGVPEGTDDAVRDEYIDDYGEPLGYGIYAFSDTSIAIMVIVQGTVNGMTGVAATDYMAGLYFSALAD